MFGLSFGDLALRKSVEPPGPSFADKFNVHQEYAVLAFRLLVEAGLIAFPNTCFDIADEGPEEVQHGSPANLPKIFVSHLRGHSEVVVVGFCA